MSLIVTVSGRRSMPDLAGGRYVTHPPNGKAAAPARSGPRVALQHPARSGQHLRNQSADEDADRREKSEPKYVQELHARQNGS